MTATEPPSDDVARVFDIDLKQYARRVEHLVAYAALTEVERYEPDEGGLSPAPARSDERDFALLVDAASALREAAMLALVSAPDQAPGLLRRSGRLFLEASVPYGVYLVALSGRVDEATDISFSVHLELALRSIEPPDSPILGERTDTEGSNPSVPSALPQQQLYLLLAGVASDILRSPRQDGLRELMARSPHRNSNLAVGALGLPTMRYWSAVESLMDEQGAPNPSSVPDETLAVLEWLAARHADVVASAQVNDYLWRNLASPVDVVDLDLIGLAALTMRRYDTDRVMESLRPVVERRSPMELMHIELARAIA